MKRKKIIIIGSTSGIGYETAKIFINKGDLVGVCGRRADELEKLKKLSPDTVFTKQIDVVSDTAPALLLELIKEMAGADIILNCAGIGFQNRNLDPSIEIKIAETNVTGFIRIADTAFNYFIKAGKGHFAAISSIAGVKGLGAAPAYSATKKFQNTYLQALAQLAHINHHKISFTEIRPGFVKTSLLSDNRKYPLLMDPKMIASKIATAIEQKKRCITIDWRYRILVFFWRMIPDCIWERLQIKN